MLVLSGSTIFLHSDEPVVVYFDPAYQFVSEGAGSDNLAVLVCAVVNYTECYISFNVSAYGITAYCKHIIAWKLFHYFI